MPNRILLKEIVAEASRALVRLDAVRLEELASSCEVLRREVHAMPRSQWRELGDEARAALRPMNHFSRIMEATRDNLEVLVNVKEQRTGRLEYSCRKSRG